MKRPPPPSILSGCWSRIGGRIIIMVWMLPLVVRSRIVTSSSACWISSAGRRHCAGGASSFQQRASSSSGSSRTSPVRIGHTSTFLAPLSSSASSVRPTHYYRGQRWLLYSTDEETSSSSGTTAAAEETTDPEKDRIQAEREARK
jgi:hypothetical protein